MMQLAILFGVLVLGLLILSYLFSLDEPSVVKVIDGTATGGHNMIYPGKNL